MGSEAVAGTRLELAEKYFEEAKSYVERGDPVQGSEKLYKATEECIKTLAALVGVPELEEVERRGAWTTYLLGRVARSLAETLGEPEIANVWARAYDVHVWGFHEAKYTVNEVRVDAPRIKWLLDYTRKALKERKQR